MFFDVTRGGIFSWRKWPLFRMHFLIKKVDLLVTKAFKNHIKSYKIIEIHAFLSFWGTSVRHPYFARGTGACPHPPHLQKTQVLAASNHNDLVQLSLLYIPKGFGWRGTTFRKYKTVTEHDDDHEQFNKNNSTRFHSRAQGITLQPFPTLTLINVLLLHKMIDNIAGTLSYKA